MKDIAQFKSSAQYTSALNIRTVCSDVSIPQNLDQQITELCKNGVATSFKIYFRGVDVQRCSDPNAYTNIFPSIADALWDTLCKISDIYNDVAHHENIPNMGDYSSAVENICKYFETHHCLLSDTTVLDFETILKRQIVLQTVKHCRQNNIDCMPTLNNYIKILGIDNKVILFYPTHLGYCIFDMMVLTPQTVDEFVNKLGRDVFINYLITRTTMNNTQYEHTIPLLRYFHMLNYSIKMNESNAITAQIITKLMDTYIVNPSDLEGIELTTIEHRVVADLIIALKYDENILAKLKPLITEITLVMILDYRNHKSITCAVQTFSKLKNLNFPVDNMLFVLNVVPTSDMITEIDNIMAQPDTPEYNILISLKNDPVSILLSLDDKTNNYVVDILHEKDFIAQCKIYGSGGKLDHYINISVGDEIYTLKKIDVFTGQWLLSTYIKGITECNDTEGLKILGDNLHDIVGIISDIADTTNIGKYMVVYISIGHVLTRLNTGLEYYNKFLENDAIIQEIIEARYYKLVPLIDIFEKMMCDELTLKSKINVHLMKLIVDTDTDSILECDKDNNMEYIHPSLETSDYKKIARYYFNLIRLTRLSNCADQDITRLPVLSIDLDGLDDVVEFIGKYMTHNMADKLMINYYDIFIQIVQYIPASKHTLLNNLSEYIEYDMLHQSPTNRAFKIVDTLIRTHLLEKSDISTCIDNVFTTSLQVPIADILLLPYTSFVLDTRSYIEYHTPLIDIFRCISKANYHITSQYVLKLSELMDINDIVTAMSEVDATVMAGYCSLIHHIENKSVVSDIYLNLLTIKSDGYSLFKSSGPLFFACALGTDFIDNMFSLESKAGNHAELVNNCVNNAMRTMVDTATHTSADKIIPHTRFAKLFQSSQFADRIAHTIHDKYNTDPDTAVSWYDHLLTHLIAHDPVSFGKSDIFHTEYWNNSTTYGKNICVFFRNIIDKKSSVSYGNITHALKHLEFIYTYIAVHTVPCDYSDIEQSMYQIITKFIANDDIILYVFGIVEKFNGIGDLIKNQYILDELVKNMTIYKFLLETLSGEDQTTLLSHHSKSSTDAIMENDLLFFIGIVDELDISYMIDINNVKILNQLRELDPRKIYTLYKNGFIGCDLVTLMKKVNNILDIDDIVLSDADINIVFNMDHELLIVVKILKNLEKHNYSQYLCMIRKTIKYYTETDPLGLTEFIAHVGCSIFNMQLDDALLQQIYNLCSHDPSLYEILFKSTDTVNKILVNTETCSGNMMLSCFIHDDIIMKNGLPEISFDKLFQKNRLGRYVIENLLTPSTINIFKNRSDGTDITNNIDKYKINSNSTSGKFGINNLLETSKTSSNEFMFMCRTLTSAKLYDIINGLSREDINMLMASTDEKHNNGLFYVTRYHPTILEDYIDIIDDVIFKSVNMFGETLGMYAMRYNVDSYTILENADKITKDHNYIDIHSGSLISYTVKYNNTLVEHIINAPYFNEYSLYVKDSVDMIDFDNQDMPRIKTCTNLTNIITALGNIDAFQLLVQLFPVVFSKHINEKFTISSSDYNTLRYALYINPEIASIIIGSAMCTDAYIATFCSYFPGNNFSMIANIQPASWYKIINSDKFTNIRPVQHDDYHYSKKTNIGYIIEHVTDKNKKLVQYTQSFDFTHKNVCNICCCAKAVILHSKCGHKMCVGCSLIENTCPMCNIQSSPDNQYYID